MYNISGDLNEQILQGCDVQIALANRNYMPKTCYIIGDDSLTIACVEALLRYDKTGDVIGIEGILSKNPVVQAWTQDHRIPFISSEALESLKGKKFDFLLSVSNTKILPEWLLKQPKQCAINFHNAPLPLYKGTNATCWAILDGQKQHGVVWQVMEPGPVDAGPILMSQSFPITEGDTAVSLNVKCHEVGLQLFQDLLPQLASTVPLSPKPQEALTEPQATQYYALWRRAECAAIISWDNSAEDIYKLYRALSFRQYLNTVALPKFFFKDHMFIPKVMHVHPTKTANSSPGTVIAMESDGSIRFATGSTDLLLRDIVDVHGEDWSSAKLQSELGLVEGIILPVIPKSEANEIQKLSEQIAKAEIFWVRACAAAKPLSVPFEQSMQVGKNLSTAIVELHSFVLPTVGIAQKLAESTPSCVDVALTLLFLYFARINQYDTFSVGFETSIAHLSPPASDMFANRVPWTFDIDVSNKKFVELYALVKEKRKKISEKGTYEIDMFLRYPELLGKKLTFPITVGISDGRSINVPRFGDSIYIGVSLDGDLNLICTNRNQVAVMERMLGHLQVLAKNVSENLTKSITELSILIPAEEGRLKALDRTQVPETSATVIDCFEREIMDQESLVAITCGNEDKTYRELNGKANCFAHYLLGVLKLQPGAGVAVSMDPSPELVEVILAIWKARCVYVPIDPSYPASQSKYMLQDARALLLVSDKPGLVQKVMRPDPSDSTACYAGRHIIYDSKEFSNQKNKNPSKSSKGSSPSKPNVQQAYLQSQPSDLAYIIYTSGSTGKPKGVAVSHETFFSSMQARLKAYEPSSSCPGFISPHKTLTLLFSLSPAFDTSMAAIFWPLLKGGRLVIPKPYALLGNARELVKLIKRQQVSHLICVPSLYVKILDAAPQKKGALGYLQIVILGGDKWPETLLSTHEKQMVPARLYNEYGLTETGIWNTTALIYDPSTRQIFDITIGQPAIGSGIWILDKFGQPVPPGGVGEIYIGGYLAAGYVNLPEKVNERFVVKTLFGQERRLYKTGDLGWFGEDGNIRFLGRSDNQVKVRGYRIDPTQIETVLAEIPHIKECVVVARDFQGREKELVAYIAFDQAENQKTPLDIRIFLQSRLPAYMIPTFYVILDQLPLTHNLKIDRSKLPAPMEKKRLLSSPAIPPSCIEEESLLDIWNEILGYHGQQIGITDDFFNLGGTSLQVTTLLSRVEHYYSKPNQPVKIKLAAFFEEPTIRNLVRIIHSQTSETSIASTKVSSSSVPLFVEDVRQLISQLPKKTTAVASAIMLMGRTIFLTGATGFLGVYLLRDLLRHGNLGKIYCLVRAPNQEAAEQRLILIAKAQKLGFDLLTPEGKLKPEIQCVVGDLTKPHLGMVSADWDKLAEEVDVIYHNGAEVHHLKPYSTLRASNVCSVMEIIDLASQGKTKEIHYVSTLSSGLERTGSVVEITENEPSLAQYDEQLSASGYSQSKWVAERLLTAARKQLSIPVFIYRPGWISGDSRTGGSIPEQNHLMLLLKGAIEMGVAPDWNIRLNLNPVDVVSQVIVLASLSSPTARAVPAQVFNFYNLHSVTWKELIQHVNEHYKPITKTSESCVSLIGYGDWQRALQTLKPTSAVYSISSLYLEKTVAPDAECLVRSDNTSKVMDIMSLCWPQINEDLLSAYFGWMMSCGFLSLKPKYVELMVSSSASSSGRSSPASSSCSSSSTLFGVSPSSSSPLPTACTPPPRVDVFTIQEITQ